jgi:hypothetical protein
MTNLAHQYLQHMLRIWNLRDASSLRHNLEACLHPDIEFIDPSIVTRGIDEFEANVLRFWSKYPGAEIAQSTAIDSHHQLHRYHWRIQFEGKTVLEGFDVSETDDQGKVLRVLGFFGPIKPLI